MTIIMKFPVIIRLNSQLSAHLSKLKSRISVRLDETHAPDYLYLSNLVGGGGAGNQGWGSMVGVTRFHKICTGAGKRVGF